MTESPGAIDRELLRQLPKAELHCHLDGSVRPQTLIELGREQGVKMPQPDADSLREYMTVRDAKNLEDYLARFEVTLSVMQTASALERIAYELTEDVHRDGVMYLETRFSPVLNVKGGLKAHEVVDAVLKGLKRGEQELGVVARVIICGLRHLEPDISMTLAQLAVAYKDRGVVGFDLAGGEKGNPASRHKKAFQYALSNDMACTCHAGEGDGGASIREAVHVCGANRIGHGTRLFEDRPLMDFVNDRRIPVEICITSNVQTRSAESYAKHPVREYLDAGLNVVLNTDNRLMSATTLTDEYAHAASDLRCTFDELSRMAINGFESAFLHAKERDQLVQRARTRIADLRSRAAT